MASAHKTSPSTPSGSGSNRSKKATTKSLIVRLKLSSASLAKFLPAAAATEPIKSEADEKPASSSTTSSLSDSKAPTASPLAEGEASNGNTPVPSGTDDSVAMPPPAEGGKVGGKGKKRASLLVDGVVKPRGKPGPKKRKLDDGTADSPSSKPPHLSTAHKLGPKANQGAINAGLRALDRSGAPCRKWARGGFAIKSFTGTTWEIPRWRAPPKVSVTGVDGKGEGESGGGEGSSGKENKDSSQVESEKSGGRDVEMSSPGVQASSPAPAMVAAAS
ncbi:hypothetical protein V501_04074 [Pseudogymnoascus sp. VKM F-4519 (FW-2642)]|nr:hypothetical protein V501_04074 [Pseudogymnoascus sp. VKM F-4519 (FW-2642)]